MMLSISVPKGPSTAGSLTEITEMPCLRSRPLYSTLSSRLRAKRLNISTRIASKGLPFSLARAIMRLKAGRFRAVAAEMPSSWNTYSSGSRYPFFLAYSRMSRTWLSGEYSSWSSVDTRI